MGLFLFQYLRSSPRKRILVTYEFKPFDSLLTVLGSSKGWLLLKKGKLGVKVGPDTDTANGARGPWDIQGAQPGPKGGGAKDRAGPKASERSTQATSTHNVGLRSTEEAGHPLRLCWNGVLGTLAGARGSGGMLQVRLSRTRTSHLWNRGHFKLWHEFLKNQNQISAIIRNSLLLQKKFYFFRTCQRKDKPYCVTEIIRTENCQAPIENHVPKYFVKHSW